jgi:hypothetical protein
MGMETGCKRAKARAGGRAPLLRRREGKGRGLTRKRNGLTVSYDISPKLVMPISFRGPGRGEARRVAESGNCEGAEIATLDVGKFQDSRIPGGGRGIGIETRDSADRGGSRKGEERTWAGQQRQKTSEVAGLGNDVIFT